MNPVSRQVSRLAQGVPAVLSQLRGLGYHPKNAMEALVAEEVKTQLAKIDDRPRSYIKPSQVAAYALNRLPSLYVTSERGWQRQIRRVQEDGLQETIRTAVRQGIMAVQRDPLREVSALPNEAQDGAAIALDELKTILGDPNLDWHNLPRQVKVALQRSKASDDMDSGWDSSPLYH